MNRLYLLLIYFSLIYTLDAQTPFECDGSAILSIVDENEETTFYRMDSGSEGIVLKPISTPFPFNVNAIGYNQTDGMIYGVDPERHDLFRLSADGMLESLSFLPLEGDFYAGDISPTGGFLTLVNSDSIAMIDLGSIEAPIQYTAIQTSIDSVNLVFITDIAYHPFNGDLYAYDAILGKLVTIDPLTGLIDNAIYPPIGYNASIPALFFDARGTLFGIATDNMDMSAILFEFDLETGEAKRTSIDGNVGDRDACSCPYTLKFFQELSSYEAFPCDQIEVKLTIANLNNTTLREGFIREEFPQNFIIQEVNTPFDVDEIGGIGDNLLQIGNLTIPPGIHEIIVILEVSSFATGDYEMQANFDVVSNQNIGSENFQSDDVILPLIDESSVLNVLNFNSLFTGSIPDTLELCPEDTVYIEIPEEGNLNFLWNDGITIANRSFEEPGDYSLRIANNCDSITLETKVLLSPFSVDLGPDQLVNFASVLLLEGEVNSLSPVVSYKWFNDEVDIPCFDCPSIQINPKEDSEYTLLLENEAGCFTSDKLVIRVTREIFAPNIISPDGNGLNDFFYLQTANPPLDINYIKIYDRWGGEVFSNKDIQTNNESQGWDGKNKGKQTPSAVYLWIAEILFPDGKTELRKGEFVIIR